MMQSFILHVLVYTFKDEINGNTTNANISPMPSAARGYANTKNASRSMSYIIQGLTTDGPVDKDNRKISSISIHSGKSWIFG